VTLIWRWNPVSQKNKSPSFQSLNVIINSTYFTLCISWIIKWLISLMHSYNHEHFEMLNANQYQCVKSAWSVYFIWSCICMHSWVYVNVFIVTRQIITQRHVLVLGQMREGRWMDAVWLMNVRSEIGKCFIVLNCWILMLKQSICCSPVTFITFWNLYNCHIPYCSLYLPLFLQWMMSFIQHASQICMFYATCNCDFLTKILAVNS